MQNVLWHSQNWFESTLWLNVLWVYTCIVGWWIGFNACISTMNWMSLVKSVLILIKGMLMYYNNTWYLTGLLLCCLLINFFFCLEQNPKQCSTTTSTPQSCFYFTDHVSITKGNHAKALFFLLSKTFIVHLHMCC